MGILLKENDTQISCKEEAGFFASKKKVSFYLEPIASAFFF
jgi:hypothetical protein